MKLIREITWSEVYEGWRAQEATDDLWREFFKNRGHESWEEFRAPYIQDHALPEKSWQLFEIEPEEIPNLHCGPFPGWQALGKEIGSTLFKDIAAADNFSHHEKIEAIKQNFPAKTQLFALRDGDQIQLFEGHHRAVALTQLLQAGQKPEVEITIASPTLDKKR
jgi:hypothetical protein